MTTPFSWADQYTALIGRLPELIAEARLTFGGFSVCTDVYLSLHETFDRLDAAAGDAGPARKVMNELRRRALGGIGGELAVEWAEGPAWIDAHCNGRHAVGGTNLQAAHMLAMLGAPAMSALEDRSAGQLGVIHPDVLVATDAGISGIVLPVTFCVTGGAESRCTASHASEPIATSSSVALMNAARIEPRLKP